MGASGYELTLPIPIYGPMDATSCSYDCLLNTGVAGSRRGSRQNEAGDGRVDSLERANGHALGLVRDSPLDARDRAVAPEGVES